MRDTFDNWTDDGFEHEIAHGHMGRQVGNRALRKHRILTGVLEIGRNVCFKKDAAPAPAPDPRIGQAATMSAELGNKWLDFSKEQFAKGELRQDVYDSLTNKVVNSALATQDRANQWAADDRASGLDAKTRFDQYGDRAALLGDQHGHEASQVGSRYAGWLGSVAGDFGQRANDQFGFAKTQQDRYSSTFAPIEDRIAKDAMEWDSDARLASEAAKARGDVLDSSARARAASTRSMAAMGISPTSGRFAGQQRSADLQEALAAAGAENVTRDNVRSQAQQLRGGAAAIGRGVIDTSANATSLGLQARQAQQGATQAAYGAESSGVQMGLQNRLAGLSQAQQARTGGLAALGIGNTSANTSLNAGSSAVSAGGAANSNFYANNGIMGQGFTGAMQGAANQGNILNNLYGNQLQAWGMQNQANAQSSAGMGSMIGTIGGAAISYF